MYIRLVIYSVRPFPFRFHPTGADIVVATPGRLSDLLERYQIFDLRELEVLVLDEADTLLNMGFKPTLTSILSHMPKQRRTGLFSATQTRYLLSLISSSSYLSTVDFSTTWISYLPITQRSP